MRDNPLFVDIKNDCIRLTGVIMLSIPFLKTVTRKKSPPEKDQVKPDLTETISRAADAIRENNPSRALYLVAPWLTCDKPPNEIRLVAGRALAALGRYPEALGHFEAYLKDNPGSVEGLLAAGLAAARARELARAIDWFNRASRAVTGRAQVLLEALPDNETNDPIIIEELVAEVESYPEDRDRALALICVLGRAGHFRAVEKYIPMLGY